MKSQCGICFKVFSRHYDMLRHKRGVHGLTKQSPQFDGYTDVIQGSITYPKQIIQHREPSHECLNTSTDVDEQNAKHMTMEPTKKLMLVDPASYCRQQKAEYTVPNAAINTLGSLNGEMKTSANGHIFDWWRFGFYSARLSTFHRGWKFSIL